MAVTSTTTLTAAMQTYYDNVFLSYYKEQIPVMKQGQNRPIPKNAGKTIDFFRYHPYALVTASGTEGTVGTEVSTIGVNKTASIAVWKNYTKITEFLRLTSRDKNLENIVELMAQNCADSLEWETQRQIALYGATYVRSDCNNTYQFQLTCGGDVSNSATTTVAAGAYDTFCATDDLLIGGVITFRKGFGYGQSRLISDFTATAGVVTWETALDETLRKPGADTGTAVISAWHCGWSGDALQLAARLTQGFQARGVYKAVELLEEAGAPKFSDGFYHGVIDPKCKNQFMQDSDVLLYMQSSRPAKLENRQIGEYSNVMWYMSTMPVRLGANAWTSYANATWLRRSDGKYYVTWVFGKNAFGVVDLTGRRKKIIVKTPGPQSISVPTDEYSTVGWKSYFAVVPLNATYAVAIVSRQGAVAAGDA